MSDAAQNSRQSQVQKGSATLPSYTFLGDSTTGFYSSATGKAGFTTGGTLAVEFSSGGIAAKISGLTVTTTTGTITVPNGVVATFPPASANIGYLEIPQNAQTGNYTLVLTDSGKHIYMAAAQAATTYTIPANSSVAYPIGTAVTFVNSSTNNMTIAITTDTLTLSPAGTTGSRTLARYGMATAIKVTSTLWYISGTGLT
jgi:hypothetical protein